MKKIFKTLIPLIICIVLSSLFVYFGKYNYQNINTPKYAPPSIVFPIVWSIIYLIFGTTIFKHTDNKNLYRLYLSILSMHTIWNLSFFVFGYFLISLILLLIIYFVSWIYVHNFSLISKKYFYVYLSADRKRQKT